MTVPPRPDGRPAASAIVLGALLMVAVAQVARTLFPAVYLMGEDGSFALAGLLTLAIYAAPAFALPLLRLDGRTRLVLGAGAIVAARLALQLVHPIPSWLAMVATGVALVGATLAVSVLGRDRRPLAIAVVLGLALDTALRSPFRSWDLAWQDGAAATATTVVVALATVVALWLVARRPLDADTPGAGLSVAALGPYLALQILFLQNVGFVGSHTSVDFGSVTATVLMGDVIALMALAAAFEHPATRGLAAVVGATTTALVVVVGSLEGRGPTAAVLVTALQPLATVCLGWTLAAPPRSGGRSSTSLGTTGAALSFLLVALLWQLHIDSPLPIPRASIPAAAALALGVAATVAAGRNPAPRPTPRLRAPALAASIIALVPVTWLTLDRPSEAVAFPEGGIVRVVQFNVRGALGPDGQLDPDAVARAIASSDPDVVILQEVARGWPIFGAGDVLARIQQRLDMPYRFEPAADGQFGNAILSRLPMEPVSAGTLPEVPGKQARSYLAVHLDVGGDEPLLVIGTHLESDDVAQIEAILDVLGDAAPAIVAGDLNMQPDDVENVRRFTDAGLVDAEGATGDPCRTTSAEPTSACDRVSWVFVTSDVEILGFRIGTVVASDHLPVHVRIAVPA
jgi:endonuclease/exonuclease/phosphatase family metal-dependent hydrolase